MLGPRKFIWLDADIREQVSMAAIVESFVRSVTMAVLGIEAHESCCHDTFWSRDKMAMARALLRHRPQAYQSP
jgi:hypothetical protein